MNRLVKDYLVFLGPLALLPGVVVALPLLEVLALSFKSQVLLFEVDRWVGIENYKYLLGSDLRFFVSLMNTLYVTGASVGIEFFLGLAFALYLRFVPGRLWLIAVLLLPWAIPNVISAKLWQWMYHSDAGIINYLLRATGLVDGPIYWLSTPELAMNSAILADVWKTTPFITLLLYAGLKRIPQNILDAARVDKTPCVRFLCKIILPQLRPVILTAVVLRTLDAFRVFDVIYVMTGGGPANSTETLSIYAYRTYFQALQFGYGSSIVIIQVVLMVLLTLILMRVLQPAGGKN